MTEIIAWSLFLVVLAVLVPTSRFVERVTGRKGRPSGSAAFAYYVVLGGGLAISMLFVGYILHTSIWTSAALAGVGGGICPSGSQATSAGQSTYTRAPPRGGSRG